MSSKDSPRKVDMFIILDDILNELRNIKNLLTDTGVVLPKIVELNDGETIIVNTEPTTYYKDVDIVNRGPGTLYVTYEVKSGHAPKTKIDKTLEVEIDPGETDSLTFNEPRIGKIWLRAKGKTKVKIVFTT